MEKAKNIINSSPKATMLFFRGLIKSCEKNNEKNFDDLAIYYDALISCGITPSYTIEYLKKEDLYTTNNSFGYVYVMINPSLPDIVKIGKTTRDPNERAKELSAASGVPTPFILVYYKPFKDCHLAELVIHKYFEDKGARVNGNREFFKVTTVEAIDMIDLYHKMQ